MTSAASPSATNCKVYVVEHLDPELGPWSALEYLAIAHESHRAGARFCLSSVSPALELPTELKEAPGVLIQQAAAEEVFAERKGKVCLLDPGASADLRVDDGDIFDVFLFGGILGDDPPRVPLNQIPYVDDPELRLDEHESTEMPFRYIKGPDGQPVMPSGMFELIKKDSEKGVEDLF
ncbi:MAG: hypothetical protein M1833_001739 [Piccolia ochrophora]|nr:MAG: hypothetical protein M1833_001739 [Piccolia ochrophora]